MKKRSFLKAFVGQGVDQTNVSPLNSNLTPYAGEWNYSQASHLLRRTCFGPTRAQVEEAVSNGLETCISNLFTPKVFPDPPINFNYNNDPNVPIGETWINSPIPQDPPPGLVGSRLNSLTAWMLGQMNRSGVSIKEKLWLFWHNHFAISGIQNATVGYHYLSILLNHSLGNFRTMVEEITISPAMLNFLNGNENTVEAPNENYARELLELFTIGSGPLAGDGDYSNYTEQDVVEMARALTGWRSNNRFEPGDAVSFFIRQRHDSGDKQLSYRFDNKIISNKVEEEYKEVIDIILEKVEVAKYLCRQLHIWFIGNDISTDVEENIIGPMAQIMYDNNYEIQPALEALLRSEYFYEESHRGCMITHPLDFIFKNINGYEINQSNDILVDYRLWSRLFGFTVALEMEVMNLPSVAGWKAFYQQPQYGELWINSAVMPIREQFNQFFINGVRIQGVLFKLDVLDHVSKITNAGDPNALITTLALELFAYPISQGQLDALKEILIPGLPDFEWTVEYDHYLSDPSDIQTQTAVRQKLESLIGSMLKMPENYLI